MREERETERERERERAILAQDLGSGDVARPPRCYQVRRVLTSHNIWSEIFTKRNFIDFITIPGSLSHVHFKTCKIQARNVVKLNNI